MVSIGLFTNQKSGKNRMDLEKYDQNRRLNKLKSIVKDGQSEGGRVYVTGKEKDYLNDLENKVKQARMDKPDVIAIDGGDGTMSTVLTTINKHWNGDELPPIAIVEGGTFNVLAKRMKIRKPFKYLQDIVNRNDVNDLTIKGINMMRVYDNDLALDHLSFSAGVGFPVTLLEEIYKRKHLKLLRVGLMTLQLVGSAIFDGNYHKRFDKKQKFLITEEGHAGETREEDEWLGIVAQSIESLGLPRFMQPRTFRNAETEGRFYAVGATVDIKKLLMYFPSIYAGDSAQYLDHETNQMRPVLKLDRQLKSLRIQSEEPFNYQFNGELSFGKRPCRTRDLYITAEKSINFIEDHFKTSSLK